MDHPARLAALRATGLLDTPAEESFDRLTRFARDLLDAPVALVSLVDADRQFFKSALGLPEPWSTRGETRLSHSFCQHVVASGEPLIIEDAREHPLVRENLAIEDLGVIAYAGIPMITAEGHRLGSFCAIDTRPRRWTDKEIAILRDLAAAAMTEIELRLEVIERRHAQSLLEAEKRVLQAMGGGWKLPAVLQLLADEIRNQEPATGCSIFLMDRDARTLHLGAAAGLPTAYLHTLDGIAVGEGQGSCGTAASRAEPVIVEDIAADPLWDSFREPALAHGFRACWSLPIVTSDREVLGAFAIYGAEPRGPRPHERERVVRAAQLAALAIAQARADEAIRTVEEQFHQIADNVNEAFWIFEPFSPHPLYISPAFEAMTGLSVDHVRTNPTLALERVHAEDRPRLLAAAARVHEEAVEDGVEFRFHHADGTLRWLRGRGYPVRNDDGSVHRIVGTTEDVSGRSLAAIELRAMESRKRESEARLSAIIDAAMDAVVSIDAEQRVVVFNPAAERLFGWPAEEAVGQPLERFIPVRHRGAHRQSVSAFGGSGMLARSMAGGTELTALRRDGTEVPIEASISKVRAEGQTLYTAIIRDVTKRKEADAALRHSEERYRLVARATREVIWEWDPATDRVFWNEGLASVLFHTTAEAETTTAWWVEQLHPDDRARVLEHFRRAIDGSGNVWSDEYRVRRGNGEYASVLDRAYIARDDRGGTVRVTGAMIDLTEREAARRALQESEERYRALFDAIPGSMAVIDPETGRFLVFNDAAHLWLGYSREEFSALTVPDIDADPDRASVEDLVRRSAEAPSTLQFPRQHRTRSGEVREVLITTRPFDLGGRRLSCCTWLDTTDLVQAERALRQSEQRYRSFFDNDITADVLSTPDGRIIDCNRAFLQTFGYPSVAAARAARMDDIYVDAAVRRSFVERIRRERRVEHHEQVLRSRDGRDVHVIENAFGIFDESGELVQVQKFLFDITEYKRVEGELRQAQKMEAIGQLAGGVAHDFNNMLTAITGHADLVLSELTPEDPIREDLEEIRRAADRSAALTRQLLAFSRKQVLQPKVLNLNEVVAGIGGMLRRLIGEHIQVVTVLDPDLPSLYADPGQMEQVILNLVVNARDAMPAGGTVTIETGTAEVQGGLSGTPDTDPRPGRYVLLTVSDTGVGMDEPTRSRIFEPFFTTKEAGQGTGLGLATVYGIARQSGGSISVESAPGSGSTFRIHLPVAAAAAEDHGDAALSRPAVQGTGTVLVVEDEAVVRSLVQRVLSRAGYTVLEAANGVEGLRVLDEHPHPIHLVLTDLVMPGMSGRELADRLSEQRPELRVVFMSGYTDDTVIRHGIIDATADFIEKPFTPEVLLSRVADALRA